MNMLSQDSISLSLPDTQNIDAVALTQSQDLPVSQQKTVTIWGRLCPNKLPFKPLEMTKDEYTLGRAESCDICVNSKEFRAKWVSVISKVHFRIIREYIGENTNDSVVYLEDLSHNGTFVNKERVGNRKRVVLESNDVISLAQPYFAVYIFMSTTAFEGNELPMELKSKYAVSRKLGSGAGGEVKMVFTKNGCKKFAMKTIVKAVSNSNGYKHGLNDPEKIMNEVRILKALRHPCVIRMEEIVDTPSTVYIVLELMEGGELFERITSRGRLTENHTKLIFYQVVLAVHYLHECGITHRDLKPENILLASNADITLAKVSDFGLSKLVDAQTMMKTFCGTPMYVAPEILLTGGRGSYTNKVDIWSLGVILYACLSGAVPFNITCKEVTLQDQIKRGLYGFPSSRFGHVSDKAIDLIKRMMTVDPKKRITIKQVLLHPWLQDRFMRNTVHSLINYGKDENCPPVNLLTDDRYKHDTHAGLLKRPRIDL
ncbi:ovarian-specific serine/threonine-protein kinase Lok-like [Vespula maculifrons]|uniref:Ovarian-specific serine/threonine-protein kinase Lok n=3 Tax=Vespula TaxID=7451 RepID=A0A834UDK7_VESPE|nr:ovarian-specific serine/threonine-protein kinase Lok [Vespula pensylvanica]XP_050846217.1 ovarian-specific serine/threonine-protein kinase Lok-like [Vespula vulgaris]KAF7432152.1 hypothetical protein H0235_005076 [Vespula pensylvanica]